jgi:hypothetical protein
MSMIPELNKSVINDSSNPMLIATFSMLLLEISAHSFSSSSLTFIVIILSFFSDIFVNLSGFSIFNSS